MRRQQAWPLEVHPPLRAYGQEDERHRNCNGTSPRRRVIRVYPNRPAITRPPMNRWRNVYTEDAETMVSAPAVDLGQRAPGESPVGSLDPKRKGLVDRDPIAVVDFGVEPVSTSLSWVARDSPVRLETQSGPNR